MGFRGFFFGKLTETVVFVKTLSESWVFDSIEQILHSSNFYTAHNSDLHTENLGAFGKELTNNVPMILKQINFFRQNFDVIQIINFCKIFCFS